MNLSLRTKGMARYSLGSFGQRDCRISFVCCASDRLVALVAVLRRMVLGPLSYHRAELARRRVCHACRRPLRAVKILAVLCFQCRSGRSGKTATLP